MKVKKEILFTGMLIFVLILGLIVYKLNKSTPVKKAGSVVITDKAVAQAKRLFRLAREAGTDLSVGPCLSNDLMPDWVADVVHSPRQPVDDQSQNQCQAYFEGRARHFVELDTSGNLVRVR